MCLPALDADNRQPELAQAVVERRSHSARLKQDPPAARKFRQLGCDIGGCRRDLGFVDDPAGSGYDANVRLCHRDIQAGEIVHGWPPLPMMRPMLSGLWEEPPTITRC